MKKINIAVVGLRFGSYFIDIYKEHPDVGEVTIFDTDNNKLQQIIENKNGFKKTDSFEAVLEDPSIDAVHLLTPIPLHADQSAAVLEAGKHCACAVPMATSLDDIRRITAAVRKSGKNYMMMETTLYTYHFLYVSRMLREGTLGKIQFLRGSHYQDMQNWPAYWRGLPPMWYGTHAIAPITVLSGSRIHRVHCFGSGSMAEELKEPYGNPFPVESALFEFENGLKGEVTRSLFETARVYQEGMFVYGSDASFEWGISDRDDPYVTLETPGKKLQSGRALDVEQTPMPNFYQTLPEELWHFTVGNNYDPQDPEESLKRGSGAPHHGSHPHLVNEFVRSCIEGRKPRICEKISANITAAGICAHESAMRNGEAVIIPEF